MTNVIFGEIKEGKGSHKISLLKFHTVCLKQLNKNNVFFVTKVSAVSGISKYSGHYVIKLKLNSVALVRTRTIPTERPPPVGEV